MAEFRYIPRPPHINRKHIDGPLLTFSDGQMHWLTWRERLLLWLGEIDAWGLQRKYRPDLLLVIAEPESVSQQLIGRARYLRDRGEIKTPELLEAAVREITRLSEGSLS